MSSLILHSSNRMEALVDALGELVSVPAGSPLRPETVAVQSRGMERWLSLRLCERLGVWANCRYPFAGSLIGDFMGQILGEAGGGSVFEPTTLCLRIFEALGELPPGPAFAPVAAYLGSDDPLKRFQLAARLAKLFDQYSVFRPRWILDWQDGGEEHWQARLFRGLLRETPQGHRALLLKQFRSAIAEGAAPRVAPPARISVFGLSSLPPYHLEVLQAMARFTEVHLFLLNPCRQYWFDLMGAKSRRRLLDFMDESEAHAEEGHPLLTSMGSLGRHFFRQLHGQFEPRQCDHFIEPGRGTLLAGLQSDLLDPWERPEGDRQSVCAEDFSLRIHNCHGPHRELEVLQDQLLDLFERLPDLRPRDILVMTPEIDRYAPYISAVFDAVSDAARRIPYSLADRSVLGEGGISAAFMALLGLAGSRFSAPAILDLLELDALRRRFGITEADLPLIGRWVQGAGIRWGIDGEHRAGLGLAPFEEHSWAAGLERLLLACALPEAGLFEGIAPAGSVSGQQAQLLGRFADLIAALVRLCETLERPASIGDWSARLLRLLEDFLIPEDPGQEREAQKLRELLAGFASCARGAGSRSEVPLEVPRAWLAEHLGAQGTGGGFLGGGVTFCALLPMRSVPFRVVALLGMNDGEFPRLDRPLEFDLMKDAPEPFDPSRRNEDRYLFLEALLSARDCLLISYVGQSIRDNSPSPPSVLVSELLDALDEGFDFGGGSAASSLVRLHPLQPFSAAYFAAGSSVFSYSRENARACLIRSAGQQSPPGPFAKEPLEAMELSSVLELPDLLRCFKNPSRYFLQQRLGLRTGREEARVEDCEPFALEGLERFGLMQEMVERRLGQEEPICERELRARMKLPPAAFGEQAYARLARSCEQLCDRLFPWMSGGKSHLDLELTLGGLQLRGRIDGLYPQALVRYRPARIRGADLLSAWIEHLALQVFGHRPCRTLVVGEDADWELGPAAEAQQHLLELLELRREALCRPLAFFPETSLAFARKELEGESGMGEAKKKWMGGPYGRPESEEESFAICFGEAEPFTEEFVLLSKQIYGPLLRCLRSLSA